MTLPKGLTGKLAGIPYCSEAQIEAAKAHEAPSLGVVERDSPSCPLATEIGAVTVGAGAGITPLYVQGRAYLAGPYKGAPLSLVIVTPAVAGPFDLGAVVVRTALYVDSESAQIHAVSDPLPEHPAGHPAGSALGRPEDGQAVLHPQPDLLRSDGDPRRHHHPARPERGAEQPLPGGRLLGPEVQAEAGHQPQGRRQAQQVPGPESGRHLPQGRLLRQHRFCPGDPAALRVPRPSPHRHHLHPGPVCRRQPAPRPRSTARPAPSRRSWTSRSKARSTCAPRATNSPTWSPPSKARSRSTSSAASTPARAAASATPSKPPPTPRSPSSSWKCGAAREACWSTAKTSAANPSAR